MTTTRKGQANTIKYLIYNTLQHDLSVCAEISVIMMCKQDYCYTVRRLQKEQINTELMDESRCASHFFVVNSSHSDKQNWLSYIIKNISVTNNWQVLALVLQEHQVVVIQPQRTAQNKIFLVFENSVLQKCNSIKGL